MDKKPLVILTHPFFPKIIDQELKPYARVKIIQDRKKLSREIKFADALITRLLDPVNKDLLKNAPNLKAVGNFAIGIDNIDQKACVDSGVRVVNTPDVLTRSTAELTVALLFAAARRIPEGEELCRKGNFKGWDPQMLLGLELKGRRALLVGKGRIGQETAKILKTLGLKVSFITRKDSASAIRTKLKSARILSFHCPLTPLTYHWLDKKRISYLPQDCIVLNTARGPVIDENELIQALKTRKIYAAGLDVFEKEPHIPRELRGLSNVVLLPHLGSATREAREGMMRLAISGVLGILAGKHPRNEVKFPRT